MQRPILTLDGLKALISEVNTKLQILVTNLLLTSQADSKNSLNDEEISAIQEFQKSLLINIDLLQIDYASLIETINDIGAKFLLLEVQLKSTKANEYKKSELYVETKYLLLNILDITKKFEFVEKNLTITQLINAINDLSIRLERFFRRMDPADITKKEKTLKTLISLTDSENKTRNHVLGFDKPGTPPPIVFRQFNANFADILKLKEYVRERQQEYYDVGEYRNKIRKRDSAENTISVDSEDIHQIDRLFLIIQENILHLEQTMTPVMSENTDLYNIYDDISQLAQENSGTIVPSSNVIATSTDSSENELGDYLRMVISAITSKLISPQNDEDIEILDAVEEKIPSSQVQEIQEDEIENPKLREEKLVAQFKSLKNELLALDFNLKSPTAKKEWNLVREKVFDKLNMKKEVEKTHLTFDLNRYVSKITTLVLELESEKQSIVTKSKGDRKSTEEIEKIYDKQQNLQTILFPFLESILIKIHDDSINWSEVKDEFLAIRNKTKQNTPNVLGGFFKHRTRDIYDEVESFIEAQAKKELKTALQLDKNRRG